MIYRIIYFGMLFFVALHLPAQTKEVVEIIYASKIHFLKISDTSSQRILSGDVQLKQGGTYISCDSIVQHIPSGFIEAYRHIHMRDADSTNTYCDEMQYFSKTKIAFLKYHVKIRRGLTELTTNSAEYNAHTQLFTYTEKGCLKKNKTILWSDAGNYFSENQLSSFYGNVIVDDPQFDLNTDSLVYSVPTDIVHIVKMTQLVDKVKKDRKLFVKKGFYNTFKGTYNLLDRPILWDATEYAKADTIQNVENPLIIHLLHHAEAGSTKDRYMLKAEHIILNDSVKEMKAFDHPLIYFIRNTKDTLVGRADTILSGILKYLPDTQRYTPLRHAQPYKDSLRYLKAYSNMAFYSDSLQGRSDSLFASAEDSIIRLVGRPIIWANQHQVTGDSIYLWTTNSALEQMYVPHNALVVNQKKDSFYNQIRSQSLRIYFKNSKVDSAVFSKNVSFIYYTQDSVQRFIAQNRGTAGKAKFILKNNKLSFIKFYENYKGRLVPPYKLPEDQFYLDDFIWYGTQQPKSIDDIEHYNNNNHVQH